MIELPVDQYQFPEDWQVVPANRIAAFARGISWRKSEEADPPEGILVVSIPNIKNGSIDFDSKFNHYISKRITDAKRLRIGDILFVGSSGSIHNVGRNAIVRHLPSDVVAFASFTFKASRTDADVDNDFLYYLLNSEFAPFDQFCKRAADGKFNFQLRQFDSELRVPLPSPEEQRQIARLLSATQRAIEQEERLIALTTELKKSLMHKLFSEGTLGEAQKETEIGSVPESWDVVPVGDALELAQYGLSVKGVESGNYPMLRMTNQVNGRIVPNDLQWVEISTDDFHKFSVKRGDVLFNRTNSYELVGRTAIFDLDGDYVFASYLIRLRVDHDRLDPFFFNHYFNSDTTQQRLKSIATRAVSQSNISATRLKGFSIPLPTLEEQGEIVSALDVLDTKIAEHEQCAHAFQCLFRTLLHQLMTARVRVNDLDLSELGHEPVAAGLEEAV